MDVLNLNSMKRKTFLSGDDRSPDAILYHIPIYNTINNLFYNWYVDYIFSKYIAFIIVLIFN